MSHLLRRYSVEELARNAQRLSDRLRLSEPDLVSRTCNSDAVLEGTMLDAAVAPGLYATGYDLTYLQDCTMEFAVGASVTCGLLLQGSVSPTHVPDNEAVAQTPHAPVLVCFGSQGECSSNWRCGQRCMMGGFTLRPEFFDRFADAIVDDGLASLERLLRLDFSAITLPASAQLSRIAASCLDNPYANEIGALYLESATIAMLIEVARLATGRPSTDVMPARHHRFLQRACERIDADLVSPPTTIELAREVGTNVTTLQRIFRHGVGTTILGYIQSRRLEIARAMLQERSGPVGEVALNVGYASASAFSAAYRRRFGHPPTTDR